MPRSATVERPVQEAAPPTAIDNPYIAPLLAALPEDPARDELAADFRRRAANLARLRERNTAIRARLAELVAQSADLTDAERQASVAERAQLVAERGLLPDEVKVAAELYASALQAWAQWAWQTARVAHDEAVDALDAPMREHSGIVVRLGNASGSPDGQAAIAELEAQRVELARTMTPLRQRQETARDCAGAINHVVAQHFGDARHGVPMESYGVDRWIDAQRRAVSA